jgi:2-dehydropantoate 2-reductase
MTESILVWGAGAIGGTIGAALRHAGHDVTFVDVAIEHVAAIRDPNRGLRILGPVASMRVTAPAFVPEELKGAWKRVFLAVKAHHTEAAALALLPHLAADGYVVSLQNGLCEEIIGKIVGDERTVGAFINFGADWIGPGEIMYSNRGAVVVGEMDGRPTPRLKELHALMQIFDPDALLTEDIRSYLWGKLGYSALLSAQGICDLGIADTLARPELFPLWRGLAGEVMDVARAEGIRPRGFNGFDPDAFGHSGSEEWARSSVAAMVAFNRPNPKTHSGVWRDLAVRKRQTECATKFGPIVEAGRKHGISCPKLAGLIVMIREVEAGKRTLSDGNLEELVNS